MGRKSYPGFRLLTTGYSFPLLLTFIPLRSISTSVFNLNIQVLNGRRWSLLLSVPSLRGSLIGLPWLELCLSQNLKIGDLETA